MIRDLLEATRAESGKIRVEPRCVALSDLILQAVAMMRPTAQEKRIGLEVAVDHRIPLLHADPDRTLEVLINLIDNAVKFTPPEGSVVVKACMVEADPDFAYVSVADTGSGISGEALPLIFERLYQDPNTVDGNRTGLGLGLYIAKELVTLQGGRIWAASQPGQGTTFSFTLPTYSLAKLLAPVITREGQLREAIVLVRVQLTPLSKPPRGNWKEIWQQSLELLRRCVYVDKDLVLPPMGSNGVAETFFVVASTDMERVNIMLTRIGEQLGALPQLKENASLQVSAQPVALDASAVSRGLEEQVQSVAEQVTQAIILDLGYKTEATKETKNVHRHSK
jgi:hypothetical protein